MAASSSVGPPATERRTVVSCARAGLATDEAALLADGADGLPWAAPLPAVDFGAGAEGPSDLDDEPAPLFGEIGGEAATGLALAVGAATCGAGGVAGFAAGDAGGSGGGDPAGGAARVGAGAGVGVAGDGDPEGCDAEEGDADTGAGDVAGGGSAGETIGAARAEGSAGVSFAACAAGETRASAAKSGLHERLLDPM